MADEPQSTKGNVPLVDRIAHFSEVCREIGLPPSTAIGIFAKAVVRDARRR